MRMFTNISGMGKRNRINYNEIYSNPLPIVLSSDLFGPLPQIYPHNPISWLFFGYKYMSIQLKSAPLASIKKFNMVYEDGIFKVKVDHDMQNLWAQGFFGKGSLSRSDPSWKTRTSRRLNLDEELGITSEEITKIRRDERKKFKIERSKLQELELKLRRNELSPTEVTTLEEIRQTLSSLKPGVSTYNATLSELGDLRIEDQQLLLGPDLKDLEYLQLQNAEALFLRFALNVVDIDLSLVEVFRACCSGDVSPNNKFIIEYAVYHHYRSLGWCARSGIKFGCDLLLYKRGPPFSHAEHAVLIMPNANQSWLSISSVSRVIGGVKKNLVMAFVDVPEESLFFDVLNAPTVPDNEKLCNLFKLYRISEILYRRWIPSRNRD